MNDLPAERDLRRAEAERRFARLDNSSGSVSVPGAAIASIVAGVLILANVDVLEVVLPLYLIVNGVIALAGRYF